MVSGYHECIRISRALFFGAVALLSFAVVPQALAAPELRLVEPSLAELPFGQNRAALRAWIAARLASASPVATSDDLAEKARVRAAREAELDGILRAEVAFAGGRTPWDASLLAGEFGHGSGESLVVWQDDGATHYFFLAAGMLWKYASPISRPRTLEATVEAWRLRLGPPLAADPDGRAWRFEGKRLTLALRDLREAHGAALLVIADREAAKNLASRRRPLEEAPAAVPDDPVRAFLLETDGE